MTPNRPPGLPPVPRDHAELTFSEVVPFRSSKIKLLKSPLFFVLLISALISPALFDYTQFYEMLLRANDPKTQIQQLQIFMTVVKAAIFLMLLLMQAVIYFYARPARTIWTYMFAYIVVVGIMVSPLLNLFLTPFREVLPGGPVPNGSGFGAQFVSMFFGAGLAEEFLKQAPALIGVAVTYFARTRGTSPRGPGAIVAVRGPLDGVLMGIFAGAAFILIETAIQYVPDTFVDSYRNGMAFGDSMTLALFLLFPRVLGGAVGHMAYAAIFGYFIGLGAIRPRQFWKLFLIGWLSSALLHALWNSVSEINGTLSYGVALLSAIGAAAVLLKARQLDAAINGSRQDGNGSILVDRRPVPAAATGMTGVAPFAQPVPVAAPVPPPEGPLALSIDGFQLPLVGGGAIDLGAEPALAGRGAGVGGAVVAHPTRPGVLGLRNTGAVGWTAWLRDGSQQRIERDQNVRLAPGVRIAFAPGLIADVVARG